MPFERKQSDCNSCGVDNDMNYWRLRCCFRFLGPDRSVLAEILADAPVSRNSCRVRRGVSDAA